MKVITFSISACLLISMVLNSLPVRGQSLVTGVPDTSDGDAAENQYTELLRSGGALSLPDKMFGEEAEQLSEQFERDAQTFISTVISAGNESADRNLDRTITERTSKPGPWSAGR